MKRNAQVGIEFILLTIFSLFLLLVLLTSLSSVLTTKTKQKAYFEVNDIAISIQQEILLASELHDGYTREFYVPKTVRGLDFSLSLGNASSGNHLKAAFENQETYYLLPPIIGSINKGDNVLRKEDGLLYLND